jgi:hypothetical protein
VHKVMDITMNLDEVAMATPTSSTASFDWSELLDSKTLAEVFGDLSLVTGFATTSRLPRRHLWIRPAVN